MSSHVRRPGLVARFALMSLVLIAALGVVLAGSVAGVIRDRNLESAERTAELASRLAIQSQLTTANVSDGLPPEALRRLDRELHNGVLGRSVTRLNIWNRGRQIVYSSNPSLVGSHIPPAEEERLVAALAGRSSSRINKAEMSKPGAARLGRLLEVYVPVTFGEVQEPAGTLEIYLPYEPVAAAIERDTLRLYVLLFAGLGLLWAALFRIVYGASRRLNRQTIDSEHQALHDALTGLPNRKLFYDRAQQAVTAASRSGKHAAVMLMDLDRFKEINDTLGHHSGDLLLREIGPRLQAALRDNDTVARLGGDEFAVLLPSVPGIEAAVAVAQKIRGALSEAYSLDGLTVEAEASIGVALSPDHGADAPTLLQRADVAMYVAKRSATGVEVYASHHDRNSRRRLTLIGDLRRAIANGELLVRYQPIIDMRTRDVSAVEALLRWHHPVHGVVAPDEFVRLAEDTGLMQPLTAFVLKTALRQRHMWRQAGYDFPVSVNLSMRNLHDVGLPDEIERLLQGWRLPADALELEITESSIMADPPRAMEVIARLYRMGLGLVIDDFGTGYSSLAHLKQLPVRAIKIDRSFVIDMDVDDNDATIVRSAIDLAKNLGLSVVAEGVESEATWARLSALGCDHAQGNHLSRPLPPDELEEWLAASRTSVVAKS
jgi:diguanylate cyclase (GGDEF)-like protein